MQYKSLFCAIQVTVVNKVSAINPIHEAEDNTDVSVLLKQTL